jgi:2-methylisocitrate lyase-like PEP mutase family enzyme
VLSSPLPNDSRTELLRNLRPQAAKQAIIVMSSSIDGAKGKLIQELGARALLEVVFPVAELLRVADNMAYQKRIAMSL